MTRRWVLLALAVLVGLGTAATLIARHYQKPFVLKGAVLQFSDDIDKQTPLADTQVGTSNGSAAAGARSDFSGYFSLTLRPGIRAGQPITLTFDHSGYQPLILKTTAGDGLLIARLKPIPAAVTNAPANHPEVVVSNVSIRYSVETTNAQDVGTGVKVFQVTNTGDVPCDHARLCSPDGNWKASTASASLDAGVGNEFRNARVSCIAGPCPFTKIDSDAFSSGGQMIGVTIRDWSDPTIFVLQAEVFRVQTYDQVRQYYPTIIGRTVNFTLPAGSSGPSVEAEIDGTSIEFPLGPTPVLSWADCQVSKTRDRTAAYRCELKPWCRFR